jgi:TonB-dependent SusC/RagA subfamily outer membrane receptor
VLETAMSSVLKPGDVIEAVNGDPIMTQAGADRFTYPAAGPALITVRRGNSRVQLAATTSGCGDKADMPDAANKPLVLVDGAVGDLNQLDKSTIDRVEVLKGAAATALYGPGAAAGVIVITTKPDVKLRPKSAPEIAPTSEPLIIIDGVVQPSTYEVDVNQSSSGRRFGFAIGCLPSCSRARAADGSEYYKFDGYPPIVALTSGGPAERAGIRVGDVVTQIDGKSILGEEGALRFSRGDKAEALHVTVLRDRLAVGYLLKAR